MDKKTPLSYIELSKKNLIHNIRQFRSLIKKGTKISVVVKANAYGHGEREVVKILDPYADYFQVSSVEELEVLRKVSKKQCFVFGYVKKSELPKTIDLGCILSVFSIEQLKEVGKLAKKKKIIQELHVSIDAFLGREGFLLGELPEVFKSIKQNKSLKLSGLYAHFANIEDTADFTHAEKQIKEYRRAVKLATGFDFKNIQTHISATSGILIYEKDTGTNPLVRLGIGTYGLWPAKRIDALYKNKFELKRVLSWKTKIAQVKILPKGSTVGYGLTYKTKKKTKVAIIPQGYGDGLDRRLSNKGEVLISGTRCKILGRVMMNMCVVDVNHLRNIKSEDEVVILGKQGRLEITAEDMAGKLNTINYEVVTHISPLLPRIIV